MTRAELEFQTAWQASWKRYLDLKLTDAFLEKHFNDQKREFDGTSLRVAHLLLRTPAGATQEQLSSIQEKAKSIFDELTTTSRSFDSFVREYSEAPTKDNGGEIGWIGRTGPMPVNFTDAAFKLKLGDVSKPTTTKFGVHLIQCMEVKEGERNWIASVEEVKRSATKAYFEAIAKKHRSEVDIKYRRRFQN